MELTFDIVLRKSNINDISRSLDKIKNLKIGKLASRDFSVFMDKQLVKRVNHLLNYIIESKDDIGYIVLIAYFMSCHTLKELSEIFGHHCNEILVNAANNLVFIIEGYRRKDLLENKFFESIDNYYSLYKKWMSKDKISKIEYMFHKLEEKIKIYLLAYKKKIDIELDPDMEKYIYIMFDIDSKMAIEKLLSSYQLISSIPYITTIVWDIILANIDDSNKEHIFLIIVTELRIFLIRKLIDTQDKKDVYYNIDIQDIISSIRNKTMSIDDIVKMLSIIANKLKIDITDITNFDTWNDDFNKLIIGYFYEMFELVKM